MSRSNYDKPFYVDIGTSIVAIRCASNSDIIFRYDHTKCPQVIQLAEDDCDRMNKEVELSRPTRNCDVGTAEEQAQRFKKFCYIYPLNCRGCPFKNIANTHNECAIFWLQMPYEEGGARWAKQ